MPKGPSAGWGNAASSFRGGGACSLLEEEPCSPHNCQHFRGDPDLATRTPPRAAVGLMWLMSAMKLASLEKERVGKWTCILLQSTPSNTNRPSWLHPEHIGDSGLG